MYPRIRGEMVVGTLGSAEHDLGTIGLDQIHTYETNFYQPCPASLRLHFLWRVLSLSFSVYHCMVLVGNLRKKTFWLNFHIEHLLSHNWSERVHTLPEFRI